MGVCVCVCMYILAVHATVCAHSKLRIHICVLCWAACPSFSAAVYNQLTERQALTLDYSHAEEAALGLAARASRALTGPGLNHSLFTHTQAGLRGTIRRTGRHTTAHLSARLATCVGCKLTRVPQPGRQEIRGRDKSP